MLVLKPHKKLVASPAGRITVCNRCLQSVSPTAMLPSFLGANSAAAALLTLMPSHFIRASSLSLRSGNSTAGRATSDVSSRKICTETCQDSNGDGTSAWEICGGVQSTKHSSGARETRAAEHQLLLLLLAAAVLLHFSIVLGGRTQTGCTCSTYVCVDLCA